MVAILADIYVFKVDHRNTIAISEIGSELTIKTPERNKCRPQLRRRSSESVQLRNINPSLDVISIPCALDAS